MLATPFFSFPPVLLIGMQAAAHFPKEASEGGHSAFGLVTADLMTKGAGYEFACLILLCACLAAFMSTADSTVIGIANVATVDVVKGSVKPNTKDTTLLWGSKAMSFLALGAAVLISFHDDLKTKDGFITLIDWLTAFLWITFPTWIYGHFSNYIKSRALIIGIILQFTYVLVIGVTVHDEDVTLSTGETVKDSSMRGLGLGSLPGLACLILLPAIQYVLNLISPDFATDDHEERPMFGGLYDDGNPHEFFKHECRRDGLLTWERMNEITDDGKVNPLSTNQGKVFMALGFLATFLTFPWYGTDDNFEQDVNFWLGIPDWALIMLLGSVGGFVFLFLLIVGWDASTEDDTMDYNIDLGEVTKRASVTAKRASAVFSLTEMAKSQYGGDEDLATKGRSVMVAPAAAV